MPRKPRLFSSTGIYHIILRSVNQHIIFEEVSDYQKCLFILSDIHTKFFVDVYAYCIMDNHIHLMLYSEPDNLSSFFQSFGSRFVRWYNTKYQRSGHLFQERYHSQAIETSTAYFNCMNYIHNNPVKANVCRYPSEYRWSSYNAFYGEKNPLINVSFSYEIAGSKDSLFHIFSNNNSAVEELYHNKDHYPSRRFITDEQALTVFKSLTHLSSVSDVAHLQKAKRNEYARLLIQNNLTYRQVSRLLDISLTTVKRICQK